MELGVLLLVLVLLPSPLVPLSHLQQLLAVPLVEQLLLEILVLVHVMLEVIVVVQ
jgi:hypothetical protein